MLQYIVLRSTLNRLLGNVLMVRIREDQDRYVRGNLEYPDNGLDALTVGKKQIGDDCRYASRASHAQSLLSLRAFSYPLDDELRIA
jgi:hypothetical protein